jgi:oxalate---CoA ligase
LPQKRSSTSKVKPNASAEKEQATDDLRKLGRSESTEEIDGEEDVPKKRGRLDKEQSANGDVMMTHPMDEGVATTESPLSDIPSTDIDIEPPDMTEPHPSQNAHTEIEHVSSGHVLNEGGQQQSSFVDGVHPVPLEAVSPQILLGERQGDVPVTVSPESSLSSASTVPSASPTRRRVLMEAVENVLPSPRGRPNLQDAQIDICSVSLGSFYNSRYSTNAYKYRRPSDRQ